MQHLVSCLEENDWLTRQSYEPNVLKSTLRNYHCSGFNPPIDCACSELILTIANTLAEFQIAALADC